MSDIDIDKYNKVLNLFKRGDFYDAFRKLSQCSEISQFFDKMVKNGINVDILDKEEYSILNYICANFPCYEYDIVITYIKSLIKAGANVNLQVRAGHTPIMNLVSYNRFINTQQKIEIIRILKNAGADLKIKDVLGDTVLCHLLMSDDYKNAQDVINIARVLIELGADINSNVPLEYTLSHCAGMSWYDRLKVLEFMISSGTDVKMINKHTIESRLLRPHIPIEIKNEFVRILGESKVSINMSTTREKYEKVINIAANFESLENFLFNLFNIWAEPILKAFLKEYDASLFVDILIEKKVNVNFAGRKENTPLHLLCENIVELTNKIQYKCIKKLIKAGANVNAVNYYNITPLMYLVNWPRKQTEMGIIEIIIIMKDHGFRFNMMDKSGNNVLHWLFSAVGYNSATDTIEIAKLLIEFGADINAKNLAGYTPISLILGMSINLGWQYIIDILRFSIKAGANINYIYFDDDTINGINKSPTKIKEEIISLLSSIIKTNILNTKINNKKYLSNCIFELAQFKKEKCSCGKEYKQLKNDGIVVFDCGHLSCLECSKKSLHICKESTQEKTTKYFISCIFELAKFKKEECVCMNEYKDLTLDKIMVFDCWHLICLNCLAQVKYCPYCRIN